MILIGQYDSPFVRRVGIALRLYGMDFAHQTWSTFADGDKVASFNPLRRVPILVLDDGEVLIESGAILDHLDEVVGSARAMLPQSGPARRAALKACALATGLADKAVSLVYERLLHPQPSDMWLARCRTQMEAVLDVLEAQRQPTQFWFGDRIGHADIMVACAWRFAAEAHPTVVTETGWPTLAAHAARCESRREFQDVAQAFIPPS